MGKPNGPAPLAGAGKRLRPAPRFRLSAWPGPTTCTGGILVDGDWPEPSYGDFGSYASLAMSRGN